MGRNLAIDYFRDHKMLIILDIMLSILYNAIMDPFIVHNKVRLRRAELQLTQGELAAKAGCTRQTVAFIEKSEFTPSVALALKLAAALSISIEKLFWLTKKEASS